MFWKRTVCSIMSLVLMILSLAACTSGGGSAQSSSTATDSGAAATGDTGEASGDSGAADETTAETARENITLRFAFPGEVMRDQDEVWGALNEKSFADIGIGYSIEYIPWSDFVTKRNLYLQSGESFDGTLVFAPELPSQWSKKAFAPLNDYISPEKTPNLLNVIDMQVFEDMSINGEFTSFPSIVAYQNWYMAYIIRGDLREKYGMGPISTLEELEQYFANIKENEPGMIPASTPGSLRNMRIPEIGYMGFVGDDFNNGGPAAVDPNNPDDVVFWLETDQFKKLAEINRRWYVNGWMDPDVLADTSNPDQDFLSGKSGMFTHDITVADTTVSTAVPELRAERVILNPEGAGWRDMWGNNIVCVPHSSENIEAVCKWVDWLFSNEEHYQLLLYGIEGKHYVKNGDTAQLPEDLNPDDSGYPMWNQWYWAQGKMDLYRPLYTEELKELIRKFNDIDTEVVVSPTLGLTFDVAPVTSQATAITQAWERYGRPIYFGVVDYQDGYDTMIKAYKDAGIDAYIEEAQSQYDQWRASR